MARNLNHTRDDDFSDLDTDGEEDFEEREKETIGESGYGSSYSQNKIQDSGNSRELLQSQFVPRRAGLSCIDEERSVDLRSRGSSPAFANFRNQAPKRMEPRMMIVLSIFRTRANLAHPAVHGFVDLPEAPVAQVEEEFGSFRSDAFNAIEEEEKKHELTNKFFIPEGAPIVQRKENSWEPSVLVDNSPVKQDTQKRRSILGERHELNQLSPKKKTKQSNAEEPTGQPVNHVDVMMSYNESVVGPQNTSVPFQSTPVAPRFGNGGSRMRGRNILAQKMFDGINESQIPTSIVEGANESYASRKGGQPLGRAESIRNLSVASSRPSMLPSDSTINKALDSGADATTFLEEMKAKRAQRAAMRASARPSLERSRNVSSVKEYERPGSVVRASTMSLESRPASQASTVSRSITSHRLSENEPVLKCVHEIGFGYVAVGDRVTRDLTIENTTDGPLAVRVTIVRNQSSDVFSILSNDIELPRKDKYNLTIFYSPTEAHLANFSELLLNAKNVTYNKKVRLRGFCGVARVEPVLTGGLHVTKEGHHVLKTSLNTQLSVKLKNHGERTAFVRLKINPLHEGDPLPTVLIQPSDKFVLDSDEIISITLTLLEGMSSGSKMTKFIGNFCLSVYSGENSQRERFKEYLKKRNHEDILYDDMSFTEAFEKDEFGQERSERHQKRMLKTVHHYDKTNFFKNLRKDDIRIYNSKDMGSRQSLCDDTNKSLYETMDDMTIHPGDVDDRTRRLDFTRQGLKQ
uniref:ASH domain-containing protein n=1 Tax=Steinernema glaseri TaxID=37863 RepID=A0A1I7YTZ8_9BILA